ncbi:MAG: glycosyltransferase family 39 protein [Candidatus Promineifilaceae bacterium]|nr:glycosyltransferase family 39 protein [Candidatus Promineifilaceae bacterium]
MKGKTRSRKVVYIVTLCILLRLILFVAVRPWEAQALEEAVLRADAKGYHQLSVTLSTTDRLAFRDGGELTALRTPLYPLFVSFWYGLFGPHPWPVILMQGILDTLSCFLLYCVFDRVAGERVATFGALFYAIDPILILFTNTLYSDTLFVFLLVAGFFFFSRLFVDVSGRQALIAVSAGALFFGLATLTRPIAQYLYVPVFAVLAISFRHNLRRAVRLGLAFGLVFVLVLLPWLVRNEVRFGHFALSTSGDLNLLLLYATPVEAEISRERTIDDVQAGLVSEARALTLAEGASPERLNQFERAHYYRRVALRTIRRHPVTFIKHYVSGILRNFVTPGTGSYGRILQIADDPGFDAMGSANLFDLAVRWFRHRNVTQQILGLFILLEIGVSYLLMVIALPTAWKRGNRPFFLFCVLLALYFTALAGPAGRPRFRLPVIPFYLYFVGMGATVVLAKVGRLKSRRVA